ncbi:MAG: hypothetical protein QRY74_03220 [Chlamydia sp.]
MPIFQIINDKNEIPQDLSMRASKFESAGRRVNKSGKIVESSYSGRIYKLIEKKERAFTFLELLFRRVLGGVIVLCTFGTALFLKSVKKLCVETKKTVRFGIKEPNSRVEKSAISSKSVVDTSKPNMVKARVNALKEIRDSGKNLPFRAVHFLFQEILDELCPDPQIIKILLELDPSSVEILRQDGASAIRRVVFKRWGKETLDKIVEAMKKSENPIGEEDHWYIRAYTGDSQFSKEEFERVTPEWQHRIRWIAEFYKQMDVVQKINSFGACDAADKSGFKKREGIPIPLRKIGKEATLG